MGLPRYPMGRKWLVAIYLILSPCEARGSLPNVTRLLFLTSFLFHISSLMFQKKGGRGYRVSAGAAGSQVALIAWAHGVVGDLHR